MRSDQPQPQCIRRVDRLSALRAFAIARLAVILTVAAIAAGCPEQKSAAPARVNAVRSQSAQRQAEGFCDVIAPRGSGLALSMPELAARGGPQPSKNKWRWINVWATWCKPCIAELPLLERWPRMLRRAGVPIDLVMLSVDESETPLRSFHKDHPRLPRSVRLADPRELGPWLERQGLPAGTSIPIHIFVTPAGKVRCLRAAALAESDYPRVTAVLAQP